VLEGLEPLSFEEALAKEDERVASANGRWAEIQPHAYIGRSHYAQSLSEYLKLFGAERILLLKSEDLGRNPEENLQRVCKFLGVDTSFHITPPPNYSSPSVVDSSVQAQLRTYFGDRFPEIIESIRRQEDPALITDSADDAINIQRLRLNLHVGKDTMPEKIRQRVRELLSKELASLGELVSFPIADWN